MKATQTSTTSIVAVDQDATAVSPPSVAIARVDRLAPNDDAGLAALIQSEPHARAQILAAAATRLGNATVQRALARAQTPQTAQPALDAANQFYAAFSRRDSAVMTSLYAHDVAFHDPLFGDLRGADQVMLMWTSIMPRANPFVIVPSAASAPVMRADGASEVHVAWDAKYGLGSARIHNQSRTTLVIKDAKIIEQRDEWDLDRWTAQALPGHLGGHQLTDVLVAAAAHSYIKVVDLIHRFHAAVTSS